MSVPCLAQRHRRSRGRSAKAPLPQHNAARPAEGRSPDTLCLLESASPLAALAALGALLSTPPSRGRKWLTETCSMKDVPYLRKYHHSKICNTHTHTHVSAPLATAGKARPAPPRHTARALLLGSGSGRALQKRGPWTWKTSITNPRECNPISFKALLFGLRYFVFPTRA